MKEIRKLDMQFRAEDTEDGKMEIKGYAAVFNSPETYGYTEVIDSKAFDEADMSDVVLRYNHNDSFMVLARTRNKSLKLDIDEKGLFMDATLQDDITDHRNIFNAIKKVFCLINIFLSFHNFIFHFIKNYFFFVIIV